MKKYVILIGDRFDSNHRFWVKENDLDRAKRIAQQYEKYGLIVEIHEISDDLWDK